MAGQGAIIGVGAMGTPAEWRGASSETLNRNASRRSSPSPPPMTTRIIQGAQSGDFLRVVHQLLLGADGFYDEIFAALRIPYEPVRWVQDIHEPRRRHQQGRPGPGAHPRLPGAGPPHGRHRPAGVPPAQARGPRHHPARADPVGPGPVLRHRRLRRRALPAAADHPRHPPRLYCRTVGIEYMHIQDPDQRRWIQERVEVPHVKPTHDEQLRILRRLNAAEAFETFLQTKFVGQKRFSSRAASRSSRCSTGSCGGPPRTPSTRSASGCRTVAAQRPGQYRRQVVRPDLPRVRGQAGPELGPGLRRRQVPPRHRGRVQHRERRLDEGLPRGEPLAPRAVNPVLEGIVRGQDRLNLGSGDSPSCPFSFTATRPLRARASSPRRCNGPSCAATAPAGPSISSSTTRSASPPPRPRRAPRCTPPTWPG